MNGKLEAIWIKRRSGLPMDKAESAVLVEGQGIAGNANQGGRRQVTILEREVWEALMRQLGAELPTSRRRANLVISGLALADTLGRELRIGECVLRISGETKPCQQMEAAATGLREAMYPEWRGGAFAQVIRGGELRVGDPVEWMEPVEDQQQG